MPAQFNLRKSDDDQFHFNLTAENNEVILSSERYKSKDGALRGIESVRTNSQKDGHYDRRTSSDGKYYFVLRAANNEVIGTSEMYNSEQALENGIQAVKRVAPEAPVKERT